MTVQITIKGIKNAQRFLRNVGKQTKNKNIPQGLKNAAIFLQGEVKQSIAGRRAEVTSVDTGRFLNSVGITFTKSDAAIFSKVPYAKVLEFGTSGRSARRHFRNTKDRNKQKITQILRAKVKSI